MTLAAPIWTLPILPESSQVSEKLTESAENENSVLSSSGGTLESSVGGSDKAAFIVTAKADPSGVASTSTTRTGESLLSGFPWTAVLLSTWIIGVAICWSRILWQHLLLKRFVKCCSEFSTKPWNDLVTECSSSIGLRRTVTLLGHQSLRSPMSAGTWRPIVVLPNDTDDWDLSRRRLVLLHELAHVLRKDVLTQTLAGLACGVYWFNPICWYGLAEMRKLRELACDDLVLGCEQNPSSYADVLLDVARSYQHQNLSTAVGMARSTNVENRILAILDKTRRHVSLSRTTARLLLASATAFVCLFGTAQLRSQAEPPFPISVERKDESSQETKEKPTSDDEPIQMQIVIAEHLILFEGREAITWEQLDQKISALPEGSQLRPEFYFTNGAHGGGRYKQCNSKISELNRKHRWPGHRIGSLWPSAGARYDRLKTAADLVPDEERRLDVRVVDHQGKPVVGAEVLLMPPVDESDSYKAHHMTLVQGRVNNRIAYQTSLSNAKGKATVYRPAKGEFYLVALHPSGGFTITQRKYVEQDSTVRLNRWGALTTKFKMNPGEKQNASLATKVAKSPGLPVLVFNQHWADDKLEAPTYLFEFKHVPSMHNTTIERNFPHPEGVSYSMPGATVSLLPNEKRRIDFGELSEVQREQMESNRKFLEERRKAARESRKESTDEPE